MAVQGLTPDSFKNMQLNAGAFFVDLDIDSVTIDTTAQEFSIILSDALVAGQCLGATSGGGSFVATPEVRQIEADGMRYPVIGSTVFDSWDVMLTTTLKEITKGNLAKALATSITDPVTGAIEICSDLMPDNYIPTLGWAGDMIDGRLMYIELKNVLNTAGVTLTFVDKGEGSIAVEYKAHQSDLLSMQKAPCRIFLFDCEVVTPIQESKSLY